MKKPQKTKPGTENWDELIAKARSGSRKNRRHLLLKAAMEGRADVVEEMLSYGGDLDFEGPKGLTALMGACYGGHSTIVDLLLQKGASPNTRNADGRNSLMFACLGKNRSLVERILQHGAEVNALDKKGWSAIEISCENGDIESVRLLLAAGAQCNYSKKGDMGNHALIAAAGGGHADIVALLLDRDDDLGPDLEAFDRCINTAAFTNQRTVVEYLVKWNADRSLGTDRYSLPLFLAMEEHAIEAMNVLLTNGADPNAELQGMPMLYLAAELGHPDIAETLISHGANVNGTNSNGNSALSQAIYMENHAMAEFLLQRGADPNLQSDYGVTSLEIAVKKANMDLVQLLLTHGCHVDNYGSDEETALLTAIYQQHIDIVTLLLEAGADPNRSDEQGRSPISGAYYRRNKALIELLRKFGAVDPLESAKPEATEAPVSDVVERLFKAIRQRNVNETEAALNAGARLDSEDFKGDTPLLCALAQNDLKMVRLLVERGADLNGRNGRTGETPLLAALSKGNVSIANYLVEKGADINARESRYGDSVVFRAGRIKNHAFLDLLLEKGADEDFRLLKAAVSTGNSKLLNRLLACGYKASDELVLLAVKGKHAQLIRTVIENGASPNATGRNTVSTVLIMASGNGDYNVVDALLKNGANPNIVGHNGTTALIEAAKSCNPAIAEILLKQGADATVKDNRGMTALDYAQKHAKNSRFLDQYKDAVGSSKKMSEVMGDKLGKYPAWQKLVALLLKHEQRPLA